jgi:DNA-binding NtrC family response regulator
METDFMQSNIRVRSAQETRAVQLVGNSPWARNIRSKIVSVACCPSNVLITGPTGTGKEVIARAIHTHSPRAGNPFIPVDCAAVSGTLFASHVFGHLKGAFTGANNAALGCFRAAHGGTIFLDEIGELEADVQTKLLRVLQQRTVVPIGSHQEIPIDVRIVAATNRDLEREVREGRFREDLYYRLNVVSLRTLPLRDRPQDIEDLARHFLEKLTVEHGLPPKRLSCNAIARLLRHAWPGNVRELENVLERAAFSSRDEEIDVDDVAIDQQASGQRLAPSDIGLPLLACPDSSGVGCGTDKAGECCLATVDGHWRTMGEVEREHIRRTLTLTNFNRSAAARLLGMERHQLARKVRLYDLDIDGNERATTVVNAALACSRVEACRGGSRQPSRTVKAA